MAHLRRVGVGGALGGVVVIAFAAGSGAGWHGVLPGAPVGVALFAALAVAAQSVIWSYYGAVDAAKIAEEVVDPERTLPRVFLLGIAIVTALYLLLSERLRWRSRRRERSSSFCRSRSP